MKATAPPPPRVETEATEKPRRRRFPKEYKLRILQEADACTKPGEICVQLRREGLYSSHLTNWREDWLDGTLKALERKRGPKPKRSTEQVEFTALRRDNETLREKLQEADKLIGVQKTLGAAGGGRRRHRGDDVKTSVDELVSHVGVLVARKALDVPRSPSKHGVPMASAADSGTSSPS